MCLGILCGVSVYGGLRGAAAAASAHNLGLALTLVFGILAATWWRQAAVLANRAADGIADATAVTRDSNTLNAAAATATGLGLIASGFISTQWGGRGAWACAIAFFLVLGSLGGDLHEAVAISGRQHLRRQSLVSLSLIAVTLVMYTSDRTGS